MAALLLVAPHSRALEAANGPKRAQMGRPTTTEPSEAVFSRRQQLTMTVGASVGMKPQTERRQVRQQPSHGVGPTTCQRARRTDENNAGGVHVRACVRLRYSQIPFYRTSTVVVRY
mmetsp:Transcript_1779/g.3852  ORF Transcript_1779/g.3852 Transcript_1779/m.3852 type:complete len:116 (-) Transcript_1779:25-372(-)